jgi:DNA-binding beta-propeller fold protein YncE
MKASLIAIATLAATTPSPAQTPGLTGTLVVTNKTPSTATIIDVASKRILATIPTGNGPHEVVISSDGRLAVVSDYSGQPGRTLTVIDVPALRVARTIDLGQYNRPHGMVFLPGDSIVIVTSEASGNLVLVNVVAGAIVRAIATESRGSHMVGVTADVTRAYTGNMQQLRFADRSPRWCGHKSWPVPNTPEAINVADRKGVWVGSNATAKISVIDVAPGATTTVAEGVKWPYRVLFSPDMKTVMLPDLGNEELRFIDRASKRELSRIAFTGGGPQGITPRPTGVTSSCPSARSARRGYRRDDPRCRRTHRRRRRRTASRTPRVVIDAFAREH